ncbi:AAEL001675-PA [Chamberlinius hualienensis]
MMGILFHMAATLVLLHSTPQLLKGEIASDNHMSGSNQTMIIDQTMINDDNISISIDNSSMSKQFDDVINSNETLDDGNSTITGRHAFGLPGFRPLKPNVVVPIASEAHATNPHGLTLGVFQPIAPFVPAQPNQFIKQDLPPPPPPVPQIPSQFQPHPFPSCRCVPFYLCKLRDIVGRSDGEGLIDQRSSQTGRSGSSKQLVRETGKDIELTGNSTDLNKRSFLAIPRPITSTTECKDNFVCCRDDGQLPVNVGYLPPAPPIAQPLPPVLHPGKQIIAGPVPKPLPPIQLQPQPLPLPPPPPPPPSVHLVPTHQPPACGIRNINGIVGRVKNPSFVEGDTQFGEFPWHVAILKNDESGRLYICAGALINDQFVITAAHNIKGYNPRDMRIRLGDWDVSAEAETFPFVERIVTEVYIHPYFYPGNLQNDVAILRLDRPVDLISNTHITPVCLPPRFEHFTGQRCVVTGWGKDAWGLQGTYSHILKKVDLPVLSNFDCQEKLRFTRLGSNFQLHPGFVCAGGEPGKDSCKGDGGGPLVCEFDGHYVIAGIVSWGIGCGLPNVPGVYVRVSEYLDWINSVIYPQ